MYIDETIYNGRPEDVSGRDENEVRCYDFLDGLGVAYERIDHEPANNMEACRQVKSRFGLDVCKNLFLSTRNGKKLYLVVMPGEKQFRTSVVSKLIGTSRLSFGPEDRMYELLGVKPGSASILGLMFDSEKKVQLVVDKSILEDEFFGCHPCKNTSSLKISMGDMKEKVIPALDHDMLVIDIPDQRFEEE